MDKNNTEPKIIRLCTSIVLYRSSHRLYQRTLASLAASLRRAKAESALPISVHLICVDNSGLAAAMPKPEQLLTADEMAQFDEVQHLVPGDNLGFGRGHHLAIFSCHSEYHLVLNPDVILEESAIIQAIRFMERRPAVALLSPSAVGHGLEQLFLCKRYPSLLVLLMRGLGVGALGRKLLPKLDDYEMRDIYGAPLREHPVELTSGCFMFTRTESIKGIGGFASCFFVYFEDFDLSLRLAKVAKVVFVPSVKIMHHGGQCARKGLLHVVMFMASGYKFFQKNGWRFV